jgi:hypothetical protein
MVISWCLQLRVINIFIKIIAAFVVILIVGLLLFPGCRRYLNGWLHETTNYYSDNAMMSDNPHSQLPLIFPPSAHDIHEKFNSDYNTCVYAFKFSPSECAKLTTLSMLLKQENRAKLPSWALPERWLPRYVRLGQIDGLYLGAISYTRASTPRI